MEQHPTEIKHPVGCSPVQTERSRPAQGAHSLPGRAPEQC